MRATASLFCVLLLAAHLYGAVASVWRAGDVFVSKAGTVMVYSGHTQLLKDEVDLSEQCPGLVTAMAFDKDLTALYVACGTATGDGSSKVFVVEAIGSEHNVVRSFKTAREPFSMALTRDGNLLVAASAGKREIYKHASDGTVLSRLAVQGESDAPQYIALIGNDAVLISTNTSSDGFAYDLLHNKAMPPFATGIPGDCNSIKPGPRGLIYMACGTCVHRFDMNAKEGVNKTAGSFCVPGEETRLWLADLDPTGAYLYAGSAGSNSTVYKVSVDDLSKEVASFDISGLIAGLTVLQGTPIAEQCTEGLCCNTATKQFLPKGRECRKADGVCDLPEHCTGEKAECPRNKFKDDTHVCRESRGPCDEEEVCTGDQPDCPDDELKPKHAVCRDPSRDCEAPGMCDGEHAKCPPNGFARDGKSCTWYRFKQDLSGDDSKEEDERYSVDESPLKLTVATASQAASLMAASPQYGSGKVGGSWLPCIGECKEGTCVMKKHEPTCCYEERNKGEEDEDGYESLDDDNDSSKDESSDNEDDKEGYKGSGEGDIKSDGNAKAKKAKAAGSLKSSKEDDVDFSDRELNCWY